MKVISKMKSKISVFFISLLIHHILSDSSGPNRLRVCNGEESNELNDASCNRGWWIPEAIKTTCVCVTGTWLISENYCDENFYLISGPAGSDKSGSEFSCFNLPIEFRRVVSLARQTKSYNHFLLQSNGRKIQKIDKSMFSPTPDTPHFVIRINARSEMYLMHKDGVQSNIWQKCVGLHGLNKAYTHIIKSDESITYLKSMDNDEFCDDVRDTDFPYDVSNNTDWTIKSVGSFGWSQKSGLLPVNPCSCPPPTIERSNPLTKYAFKASSESPVVASDDLMQPLRNTDPDYDSLPGDSFNIYPINKDPLVHAEHLTDNARTTASILTKLKDYVLTGKRPPTFKNPLYQYVRIGKIIFTKFCPEIKPEVVGNLIGMFRILLGNIISKYPEEYSLNVDMAIHQRVVSSLAKCLNGMNNRSVQFSWGEEKSEITKGGKCQSKKKIESIKVDGRDVVLNGEEMPSELRFINGDVMLEVAWKILLGTHYACAEYFEEYPEDLSFMYVKVHEFLTIPYVMFRWENPARGLTQAYRILNPLLNPNELGQQIDACVFAAFDSSRFNTWLGRPASENEFLPKSVMENSMGKLTGTKDKGLGKNKMLNNKMGYCVHDFNDPLGWSEIENSETSITGC